MKTMDPCGKFRLNPGRPLGAQAALPAGKMLARPNAGLHWTVLTSRDLPLPSALKLGRAGQRLKASPDAPPDQMRPINNVLWVLPSSPPPLPPPLSLPLPNPPRPGSAPQAG